MVRCNVALPLAWIRRRSLTEQQPTARCWITWITSKGCISVKTGWRFRNLTGMCWSSSTTRPTGMVGKIALTGRVINQSANGTASPPIIQSKWPSWFLSTISWRERFHRIWLTLPISQDWIFPPTNWRERFRRAWLILLISNHYILRRTNWRERFRRTWLTLLISQS